MVASKTESPSPVTPVGHQLSHIAWASIELLHNVVRMLTLLNEEGGKPFPVVRYRAKVKLHGSNCAVLVGEHELATQSRTTMLTPKADYKGFSAWVHEHTAYFHGLRPGLVVFGEWCGPGVESGMAVSQAPRKLFAVFAIRDGDRIIHEPEVLRALLAAANAPADLHVLPWEGEPFTLDFGDRAQLEAGAAALNQRVAEVEREDPWVKRSFGVSGLGEGLVLYPIAVDDGPAPTDPEGLAALMFKAKGDKHRTAATKQAVQVDTSVVASVDEFVALMVSEPRLQQGLATVCDGVASPQHTGKFLTWLVADVRKESTAELAASQLQWAQVEKAVQARARAWYLAQRG
jgi:hypothetical protein